MAKPAAGNRAETERMTGGHRSGKDPVEQVTPVHLVPHQVTCYFPAAPRSAGEGRQVTVFLLLQVESNACMRYQKLPGQETTGFCVGGD